jgi:uncharacterized protein (DUF2141 family)
MKNYVFLVITLISISCARVVSPTGGPKDIEPPICIKAFPENGSNLFSRKSFSLSFNEFIQDVNFSSKILVSPPIKNLHHIYKGKKIELSWTDTLQENTTYTFQFNGCIKDYHEGNILNQYIYAFTTGEYLDTNSIKGQVDFPSKISFSEEIAVYLTKDSALTLKDDNSFDFNYLAYTDKSGNFTFYNLPQEEYYVFAIHDANKNNQIDISEPQAFLPNMVPTEIIDSAKHYQLSLFEPTVENNFTGITQKDDYIWNLEQRKSQPWQKEEALMVDNKSVDIFKREDSLYIFVNPKFGDELKAIFPNAEDTLTGIVDSIGFRPKLSFLNDREGILIQSRHPIKNMGDWLIQGNGDTTTIAANRIDSFQYKIQTSNYEEDKEYTVILPDSALVYWNDSLQPEVYHSWIKESELKTSKLIITTQIEGNKLFQLLDAKGKVIQEKKTTKKKVSFSYLPAPKKYYFRIIEDKNGNGRYDSGNIFRKILPEKITKYNSPLEVKPNWEIEIDVN